MLNNEQELTCEEKLEAANIRMKELEDALRKEIHFRTAREVQGTEEVWLPVMDIVTIFHKVYEIRNKALANNTAHLTKIVFTLSNEGRIIDVTAAEKEEQQRSY